MHISDESSRKAQFIELFLLSFLSLFLELLIIRWMSCDIRAFAVFKTFPLVSCFVGLGAGFARGNDKDFRFLVPTLLWFVGFMILFDFMQINRLFVVPSASVNVDWATLQPGLLYMFWFSLALIVLLSGPFLAMLAIGSRLGVLFNQLTPLPAYCTNLAGAIIGSIVFSMLAFWGMAPWQLLILAVLPILFYWSKPQVVPRWTLLLVLPCILIASLHAPVGLPRYSKMGEVQFGETQWSPYQRIDTFTELEPVGNGAMKPIGLHIFANRVEYQAALDWHGTSYKFDELPGDSKQALTNYSRRYRLPFKFKPAGGDVLIVGAGSGNDVVEALQNGAKSVDAVEIDPYIIRLGKLHHPSHPYDDPRVHIICDDARDYFNRCDKKYDLIIFSHLDSHVVTGQGASVRLDNYVYTTESFKNVMRLLKPDGMVFVSFCTMKDWFKNRIFLTMKEALGYAPMAIRFTKDVGSTIDAQGFVVNSTFVAGKDVADGRAKLPEDERDVFELDPMSGADRPLHLLTDDWPYLYVMPQAVDWSYLFVVAEILGLATLVARPLIFRGSSGREWQLFFMGAAFMLLELQAISRLAQLYGSSWLTSAVTINSILIMILFANLIVVRWLDKLATRTNALYAFLFLTLAASLFLPTSYVLTQTAALGYLGQAVVTLLTVLPMFAAALIFGSALATVSNTARAMAFNLYGSVIGAMLEFASYYTGINFLVAIAGLLYLLSFLSLAASPGQGAVGAPEAKGSQSV
jgi:SAM-dependent methyltransferase